jgi:hypothetical protein
LWALKWKAQVFRHVGQPEYRGLHADQPAGGEQFVEALFAGFRAAEGFETHLQAERFLQALDDEPWRHAVGDQRQAVDLDDGQVGEGERRRQAEGHGFRDRQPEMAQHGRHDAALAMRCVAVLEVHHSAFFSCSTLRPMASP